MVETCVYIRWPWPLDQPIRNVTRFESFEKLIITLRPRAVSHISFSLSLPFFYFLFFSHFLEILAQLVITNRANRCFYLFIFFSFSLSPFVEHWNPSMTPRTYWYIHETLPYALHYVLTLIPRPSSARQCERLQSVYAIVQRYVYAMFWRSLRDMRLI